MIRSNYVTGRQRPNRSVKLLNRVWKAEAFGITTQWGCESRAVRPDHATRGRMPNPKASSPGALMMPLFADAFNIFSLDPGRMGRPKRRESLASSLAALRGLLKSVCGGALRRSRRSRPGASGGRACARRRPRRVGRCAWSAARSRPCRRPRRPRARSPSWRR
jgi:hypothetical protein